eukprot:GFUD01040097.1.p1 GENE.GFUD01040097.1~~GFUD01040097.1.p1  ORF type:complete len:631 (-),score=180.30 GFUD01040097.1:203-2095(-)
MSSTKKCKKDLEAEVEDERGHWGSRVEFLLSCVGFSVGLGNVWRFPFLAYENGGGAFLIPYVILLVLVGKPMYFMEAALGQFGQVGPLQVWTEMLPCGVGIGVSMVIISVIVAIYYNVIMAYCLVYLFNSFRTVLPWTVCDPEWADEKCFVRSENISLAERKERQTSEEQYWERRVIDITKSGLGEPGDLGEIKIELAFFLLVSWLVVLLCLVKGVKSSGKVVYFTATFPYLVLVVLLVLGLTLPGAGDGLYYLFVPKWEKLASFTVWRRAAGQVFFSLGISWGGIIMFGSYNKFTARVHIDAHIVSLIDFLTSLLASIVIFSTLGHSAQLLGVPVETVAKGGQGLAFVAYPEALSHLPAPHFWSVIFFLMLFLLGLDSEFALFETAMVAIFDTFPILRKQKMAVTSTMCLVCYLLGLPCVTQSGQYVLDLMDTYGASISVMVIAVAEMVAIMWGYGANNFCKDLQSMLGFYPGLYFKVCWVIISPLLLVVILVAAIADWTKPSYGSTPYPEWAHGVGWTLFALAVLPVPIWFLVSLTSHYTGWFNWFPNSPLCCKQSWLDRRDMANPVTANISILERRASCKLSKISALDNNSMKDMTSSTTTSSIRSYMGTMQPEPGFEFGNECPNPI